MVQVIRITIPPESRAILKKLKKSFDYEDFRIQLDKLLNREARITAVFAVTNFLTGNPLQRRTGTLARDVIGSSTGAKARVPGYKIGVQRGPARAYVMTQEHGTIGKNSESPIDTITPKNGGKYLTIPKGPALTNHGVRRRKSVLDWDNLKMIPFRNSGVAAGALYDIEDLAYIKEEGLTLWDIPQYYLLLRSVDIKPTHFISKSVEARLPQTIANINDFLNDRLSYLK